MSEKKEAQSSSHPRFRRKVRNVLLQPMLQSKLGIYCIVLSVVFAVALGLVLYFNFSGLVTAILELTDAPEEMREVITDYWQGVQLWIYLMFGVYLVSTIAVSIWYTHRLVGPTVAFVRHLNRLTDGNYDTRTYLRKGDAFCDVADALNRLSAKLEQGKSGIKLD